MLELYTCGFLLILVDRGPVHGVSHSSSLIAMSERKGGKLQRRSSRTALHSLVGLHTGTACSLVRRRSLYQSTVASWWLMISTNLIALRSATGPGIILVSIQPAVFHTIRQEVWIHVDDSGPDRPLGRTSKLFLA
jgi:hypothetical protein